MYLIFFNDQKCSEHKKGPGRKTAACENHMEISKIVSNAIENVNKETNTFTPTPAFSHEPTKTVPFTSEKQNFRISGEDSFREKFLKGDILETTSQIISTTRQPRSLSNFN